MFGKSTPSLFYKFSLSAVALAGAVNISAAYATDSKYALEEIVVTAQKRSQNLQDVPSSVATLSGEKMAVLRSAGADIKFMSARVPSLYIESSFGRTFPRFYIRGLGNSDFDLNASQPVSLIYDGVVQENSILKGAPVFDLARVEVLRGPQGTLFGRNTIAGIIKLVSRKPTQESEGYIRASYWRFNAINVEGAYGGALVRDKLSVRISGMYQRQDDWIDNTRVAGTKNLGGYVEAAGRLQLLFTPNDDTEVLLNGHIRSMDGTATVFRANIIKRGTDQLVSGFERDKVSLDGANKQALNASGSNLKITHNFGSLVLTSITGYEHGTVFSRGDIDGGYGAAFLGAGNYGPGFIPFPAESGAKIPALNQWTQEVRLASDHLDRVNYQIGSFYFHEDLTIDNFSYNTLAGGVQNGFAVQHQITKAYAFFGNINVDVSDNFKVTAGIRYSNDKKSFVATRTQSPFGAPDITVKENTAAGKVSWDLSGTYRVNDDVNVYARVAKGFRAPSIQGRITFGNSASVAKSEIIHSFEVGVKSDLLDNRGRINFTAYYYRVNDLQLTAVGGNSNVTRLLNANRVKGLGFETDMEFLITENFKTTLGASYNYTEIQDKNISVFPGGSGPVVLNPSNPNGTVSINGNPLPNAPKWVANFTARYAIPVQGGEVFAYTDWAYRSRVNFMLYRSVEFSSKNLLEGGLRVGYVHGDNEWQIAAYVRNITNTVARVGGIDFNNLTGFVNPPRKWGIEGKINF
ncbi:MAG: TonB-dependent receptor [Alphaproteobacteria bacterium]|nr:TonB-dependent receptor [Alphaproteobacteria bacterium]